MSSSHSFPTLSDLRSTLPSPSSPSPAPFSNLPFELVEEIIYFTVPIHYHSATYRERQNTLISLCLVSRLFRQIAQPLLLCVVKLHLLHTSLSFSQWKVMHLGRKFCRELAVAAWYGDVNQDLQRIIGAEIYLKILVIDKCKSLDFAELSNAPNLSALRLRSVKLAAPRGFRLPRLSELSLRAVVSENSFRNNVHKLSFPSLRAFSATVQTPSDNTVFSILTSEAPLEIISLDDSVAGTLVRPIVESSRSKILIDDFGPSLRQVDRFKNYRLFTAGSTLEVLYRLVHKISAASPSRLPSLIYLSRDDDPLSLGALDGTMYYKMVKEAYQNLFKVCKERGIEVVFEDSVGREAKDKGFSQDFWRRCRITESSGRVGGEK